MNRLKREPIQADVQYALDEIRERAEEILESARETGERIIRDAASRAEETWDKAKIRGKETFRQAEKITRRNPIKSAAVALVAIGVIGTIIALTRDND
jgi:ElaB/YqjD/DUF883 family membrane-anchored ribosome-binding protein